MDFDQAYEEHKGWRGRKAVLQDELTRLQDRVTWLTNEMANCDAQLTTLETDTPALATVSKTIAAEAAVALGRGVATPAKL